MSFLPNISFNQTGLYCRDSSFINPSFEVELRVPAAGLAPSGPGPHRAVWPAYPRLSAARADAPFAQMAEAGMRAVA